MKRFFILILFICFALSAIAQTEQTKQTELIEQAEEKQEDKKPKNKKEIIKKGYNFGPLPAIAYDADKGFQVGAVLNIFNYGDGSNYPNYNSKIFIEGSYFTKGSQLYQLAYDNKTLIPGVRWASAISVTVDKGLDFFGFNGYQSWYDYERIAVGKENDKVQDPDKFLFSPFYRSNRIAVVGKTDFIGTIGNSNWKWEVGYAFNYTEQGPINRESINKGKDDYNIFPEADIQPTLFELYTRWGLISKEEAEGGFSSAIRAGIQYDSRDKEGAPTRGIWAEGHIIAAPKFLGTHIPYYKYSVTFRHYVPIVKNNILTFAYRLNYEGTFGSSAPYYVLPYITVMGEGNDRDGMGGYRTTRGIMRNRVVGLDMFTYIAELRYRFVEFTLWNQNIAFALNVFSDGTMVTHKRDMSYKGNPDDMEGKALYEAYMAKGQKNDSMHISVGAGLRFIMNENFIVAFEYGMPITYMYPKDNPLYGQDGSGAFYINIGYLF